MIKDVKSYINTVGNRLSKAFSMEAFGTEEQLEFWELSAEHFSRKEVPAFSEIVNWMDHLYKAPVHFVYKLKDEKLILDRRHVITKNILQKKENDREPHEENPQEKEYVKNFEHQLQNLEKKMGMDDVFLEQGITSHAIGQCEHIPLFNKDGEFWGIYCAGPYTKSPDQITPKLSIVGRILSTWLIQLEELESNPQKDYREKVKPVISDLGSGRLNTPGLAQVMLRYMVHYQKVTFGAVVELTDKAHSVIASFGVDEEITKVFNQTGAELFIKTSENEVILSEKGRSLSERFPNKFEMVPFEENGHRGVLLLEKPADGQTNKTIELKSWARVFSRLLKYQQQNQSFSDDLLNSYYQMIRLLEKRREKTRFHTPRMISFVQRFGMFFGLEDDEMEIIKQTAKLHDIGYVGALSVDPGKTIGTEIDHPIIGADLIEHLSVHDDVIEGIRTHHEWVNGSGSPMGLSSEEIPWTGKIVGMFEYVVDFIESNEGDESKTGEEWIKQLSNGLMKRADVEFDMVLIPTAIQLIQSLGWEACIALGTQENQ
ncbi:HD-GYP domain-containing protein [Gracilimonas tropica]|uniref:HD-GYP domain-containing protein n=1 Tax=Gracilimonas tropica TaxID=454600 RepID=UPI00058B965D|nr:HD domain-containing phosphohydrolase [Gracilimonas tropica]